MHADGRIWSRALWDLRGALGARVADTVVLEGQFGFDGGTVPALAEGTVAAARRLYGNATANKAEAVFAAQGILG